MLSHLQNIFYLDYHIIKYIITILKTGSGCVAWYSNSGCCVQLGQSATLVAHQIDEQKVLGSNHKRVHINATEGCDLGKDWAIQKSQELIDIKKIFKTTYIEVYT